MEDFHRITKRRRRRRGTQSSEADWSSITGDILCLVAEKIDSVEDFISFSGVCRGWYMVADDCTNKPKSVAPYCMLRSDSELNSKSSFCTFDPNPSNSKFTFRTLDPKIKEKEIVLDLPELSGRQCWGSPFGWMVTFGPSDSQFSLLNPFYRATIPLPSLDSLIGGSFGINGVEYNPYKAFLMANPEDSPNSCFVFLIVHVGEVDSILAFARPGENVWSRIQGPSDLNDIICFKGKFYGVQRNQDHNPHLVVIQVDQPYPRAVKLLTEGDCAELDFSASNMSYNPKFKFMNTSRKYLVNLNGRLCLVIRYVVKLTMKTFLFKIYELNLSTRKWNLHPSLGYRCLFVGNNYTFTCKATSPQAKNRISEYPPDNFISDYILYTHDDNYSFFTPKSIPNRPDEGNFQITYLGVPIFIYAKGAPVTYPQLWIMPSLRFRRLEEMDGPRR